mgnify:CR=1 FL=1
MVFDLFHPLKKRKKQPDLVQNPEQPAKKIKDVETLKAGQLARLALSLTDSLIKAHGPRPTGSESALSTAEELKSGYQLFCDETGIDEETLHSEALHLPVSMVPFLYPIVLALLWVGLPLCASVIALLFLFFAYHQVICYKPVAEKLTKTTKGRNVWAAFQPKGETLHTIIFSAHHDSAGLSRFSKEEKWEYGKNVLLPVGCCLLLAVEAVVQLLTEFVSGKIFAVGLPPVSLIIFLSLLTAVFPLVWRLRSLRSKEASPGAGDNLVSSAITVELSRYFNWKKRCGDELEHTRLIFVSFDGEEDGLLGSKAWFARHRDMLVDPIMLNFDCIYYADRLTFLEKDINGKQMLSEKLARRMVSIAKSMGYEAHSASIPFLAGGTDAASAAKCGIEATSLVAVGWGDRTHPEVYHTSEDTIDHIEVKAVEEAISIAIRLAELVDGKGEQTEPKEEKAAKEKTEETQTSHPLLRFKKLP